MANLRKRGNKTGTEMTKKRMEKWKMVGMDLGLECDDIINDSHETYIDSK